jgi:hypothetical protein
MDPREPVLSYDSLPAGSDVLIEPGVEGTTITVPAGEVRVEVKRAVRHRAMLSAGVGCAILLLGGPMLMLLLGRPGRLPLMLLVLAAGAWGVFSMAMFLLMWRTQYVNHLEVVGELRKQATVVQVNPQRLRIETDGPLGAASHALPRERVRQVRAVRAPRPGTFGGHHRVWWLEIEVKDGPAVRVCPGREEGELERICAAVRHAFEGIGQP